MRPGKLLLAAAVGAAVSTIAFPDAAAGAVTVLGSSSARLCYLAADARLRPNGAALERCDAALSEDFLTDRDRVATLVNRGILKLRLERRDAAIADFDAAIAIDPDQGEAYLNKGMARLHDQAAWRDAVALFDTALAKRTRRPEIAFYGRAVAYENGGEVKAAYRDYRQASLLAPEWAEPRTELARFTVRPR